MQAQTRSRQWSPPAPWLAAALTLYAGCAGSPTRRADISPPAEGHDIAYVSKQDGNFDIFLLPAGATTPVNLTSHPALDFWLCWSPDGERLAFGTDRDGNTEIYTMAADGSGCSNLTRHRASDKGPSWSPDGQTIAFHSDRDHPRGEIYLMDVDGSNVRRLTDNDEYEECAAWSPDGNSLAFCRLMPGSGEHGQQNGEIYVMDRDGGNPRRLTDKPGFDSAPCWSPDGSQIAFHGSVGDVVEILAVAVDGGEPVNLTNDTPENWQPSWSPDGAMIAYCAGTPPNDYDIWIMRADGTQKRRLTTHAGRDQSPHIRPGRR